MDPDPKTAKNQCFHAMFGPVPSIGSVDLECLPNSKGPKGPPKKVRVKKAYVFCVAFNQDPESVQRLHPALRSSNIVHPDVELLNNLIRILNSKQCQPRLGTRIKISSTLNTT